MRLTAASFACLVALVCVGPSFSMENGMGRTPPMGWDPYNYGGFRFSEAAIKTQAEAMIKKGMRDAGYIWVGWGGYQGEDKDSSRWRNPDGTQKFASARINLMPWLRERGLECQYYCHPWMVAGHEEADAQQIIDAGFKKIDIDNIYISLGGLPYALKFCEALLNIYTRTGKAALIYTNTGSANEAEMPKRLTNTRRVANDLGNSWAGIVGNLNVVSRSTWGAGPGCYNNLDILWVGSMPHQDEISQFSMWCMVASVLTASIDVANMSADDSTILLNREMIAIDQDSLGIPATVVKTVNGSMEIWSRPLKDGTKAVALFNPTEAAGQMTVNWADVGFTAGNAHVRDLWKHQDLGELADSYSVQVPAHGVVVLKVRGTGSVGAKQPMQRNPLRGPSGEKSRLIVTNPKTDASATYTPQGRRGGTAAKSPAVRVIAAPER